MTPTTASALALVLRRAGLVTVASRQRSGIYVSGGAARRAGAYPVRIDIQIDYNQPLADRMADEVAAALEGYVFTRRVDVSGYHSFTVQGRA